MIHNYMEHVERIKLQQFNETSETTAVGRVRSEGNKYNSESLRLLKMCPFNLNMNLMTNRDTHITLNSMKAAEYLSIFYCSTRRERPLSLGIFPSSAGGSLLTPDPQARSETVTAESWRFADPLRPQSNTNLKVVADPSSAVAKRKQDCANLKIGICQKYVCFAAVSPLDLFRDVESLW